MRIRPARLTLAAVVLSSTGPILTAQYAESSARVLFTETIGPASNLFGWAATGLGDVSGDGVLDVAVSAPFRNNSSGRVYVLSGADGTVLWQRTETVSSSILGYSLETLDWDGDGVLDVVAGAPFSGVGRVLVLDGETGAVLATLSGPAAGSGFGASLATGGDLDGDGSEDLLVAAPFHDTASGASSGRVYAFARGALSPFASVDGPYADAEFGVGLAYAGDVDSPQDGRDELVAGFRDAASFFDGFASVYGWTGAALAFRFGVAGVGMGADLLGDRIDGGEDLSGDGVPDFVVGDLFHAQVKVFSGAGGLLRTLDGNGEGGAFGAPRLVPDVDGDGAADLVVGAWRNASGADDGGKVFVYSGSTGTVLKTITSTTVEENLGIDARAIGDFNGDGKLDLVVGAYGDGFGGPLAGNVTVFSGHLLAPANIPGPAELAGDPFLLDLGGDPGSGPVIGSPFEVFDLGLDCSGAPAAGAYAIQLRSGRLPSPLPTPFGSLWTSGARLYVCAGLHAQDLRRCFPSGFVLPADPALVGFAFTAQGSCGGRLSNCLTQTVGD